MYFHDDRNKHIYYIYIYLDFGIRNVTESIDNSRIAPTCRRLFPFFIGNYSIKHAAHKTYRSIIEKQMADIITHGQITQFCFIFPKSDVTIPDDDNVDQGFSTNKKFQPEKLTNHKTVRASNVFL